MSKFDRSFNGFEVIFDAVQSSNLDIFSFIDLIWDPSSFVIDFSKFTFTRRFRPK